MPKAGLPQAAKSEPSGSRARHVKTARRYRTIQIQAGPHTLTAADPIPGRPAVGVLPQRADVGTGKRAEAAPDQTSVRRVMGSEREERSPERHSRPRSVAEPVAS